MQRTAATLLMSVALHLVMVIAIPVKARKDRDERLQNLDRRVKTDKLNPCLYSVDIQLQQEAVYPLVE
jgi:hypothetical protein